MEQLLSKKSKKTGAKILVIALLVFAALLGGTGAMIDLISTIVNMIQYPDNIVLPHLLSLFSTLAFVVIDILPVVLLLIYLIFCYPKSRAMYLLPITFGALCLGQLIHLIDVLIGSFGTISNVIMELLEYSFSMLDAILEAYLPEIAYMTANGFGFLLVFIAFLILTIKSLKGNSVKRGIIPCTVMGVLVCVSIGMYSLVFNLTSIIESLDAMNTNKYSHMILTFGSASYIYIDGSLMTLESYLDFYRNNIVACSMSLASAISVCLALVILLIAVILFIGKNDFPAIIKPKEKEENATVATTETN